MKIGDALLTAAEEEAARRLIDAWEETGRMITVPWEVIEYQMLEDYAKTAGRPALFTLIMMTILKTITFDWGSIANLWRQPKTIMTDVDGWYRIINGYAMLNHLRLIVQTVANAGRDRTVQPTRELAMAFGYTAEQVSDLPREMVVAVTAECQLAVAHATLSDPNEWGRITLEGDAVHYAAPLLARWLGSALSAPEDREMRFLDTPPPEGRQPN